MTANGFGSGPHASTDHDEPFRLLVESVRDYAIFMLTADGRVETWNAGAERIKGYRADEIIGQPYAVFFPPEEVAAGAPARALQAAARDSRFEQEGWRVRKDGSRFWASVVITTLLDAQGGLRGFAKVTRDFSAQRQAEQTARRLEAEIAARRAAEAAEAQLRASEDRYRLQREQLAIILEGMADGVTAQSASGALLYANDSAARSCGYATAAEFMAAPPGEVLERFDAYDEHGKPFDWAQLPGRRAISGEENPSAMLRIRRKVDGEEWWSLIRAQAVRDEHGTPYLAVNIWRDVTEQRRREFESAFLAEATAVLTSGLDADTALQQLATLCVPRLADWCAVHRVETGAIVPVSVAHVDPAKVELARELQRRYPPDRTRPHGVPNVVRTGKSELIADIDQALMVASGMDPERLRIVLELGLKSALIVPLRARGVTVGALALVYAESQRRYARADLELAEELGRRAALALDNARLYREAQDAVKARDEFLSIAGHELRTPLAALLLQVGGLLRLYSRGTPPDAERTLERLQKSSIQASRIDKLIDELLDVSRITSGRLKLEFEDIDLAALAEEITARFADEAARAGCLLELRMRGPLLGQWDRLRLDQVLTNLISNAIKYGSGKPISIVLEGGAGSVRACVRDQGIGIATEHQSRIFGRFERAVSERYYGGFGLGLWITREIVEAHGGSIRLDSKKGEGSTFTVELPHRPR